MKILLAKFKVGSVTDFGNNNHEAKLTPVISGSDENKSFSMYTPNGDLRLHVTNPNLVGFFKAGDEHYLQVWNANDGKDNIPLEFHQHPEYKQLLDQFKESLKLLNYAHAVMSRPGKYPNENNTRVAVAMFVDKHTDIMPREAFPEPTK